jgi:hypothetical protein
MTSTVRVIPSVVYQRLIKEGHLKEDDFDPVKIQQLEQREAAVEDVISQSHVFDAGSFIEQIYDEPSISWNSDYELIVDDIVWKGSDIRKLIDIIYSVNKTPVKYGKEFLDFMIYRIGLPGIYRGVIMSNKARSLPYNWEEVESDDEHFKGFLGFKKIKRSKTSDTD